MDTNTKEKIQDIIQTGLDNGFAAGHIATSLVNEGYRLDPYPNGKTKDELIEIAEKMASVVDRARNLLRDEHEARIVEAYGITLDRHRGFNPDCEVCKFLAETSLVKP